MCRKASGFKSPLPQLTKASEGDYMAIEHVAGRKAGKVMLYALSTCVWCNKTKTITRYNPACSFPTLVINDTKCIVGFKENDIREALKQ
jgi:glutaredoxin-like protein NrdH